MPSIPITRSLRFAYSRVKKLISAPELGPKARKDETVYHFLHNGSSTVPLVSQLSKEKKHNRN